MMTARRFLSSLAVVFLVALGGWNTALSQSCTHTVVLYDTFGDGWTTGGTPSLHTLTVRVNGIAVLTNISLATGSQSSPFSFSAATGDVISTTFTDNGYWESECEFKIFNNIGSQLVYATYYGTGLSLTNVAGSCQAAPNQCEFQVIMYDKWGDGWNGCYLNIYIDGLLTYTNVTLPSGAGPGYFNFTVSHGQVVRVTFVVGSWADEPYYYIKQGGVQVFADGSPSSYIVPSANNSLVGTGSCASDVVTQSVIIDYADGYWARREAPDGNAVRAVFSVASGPNPQTLKAVYKLGSAPTSELDGVAQTFPLTWSGGLAEVEFTQRLNTLPEGNATVYVRSFAPADPGPANNTASGSATILDMVYKGYENFETFATPTFKQAGFFNMGWTTVNVNGGSTWQTGIDGGNVVLMHPGGEAADDWIFAPAALLDQNSSYRLQGLLRTAGSLNKTIQLAYGPAPDPAQMTVFATLSGFTNTSYMEFKSIAGNMFDPYFNTVAGPTPIYVGIHLTSANTNAVYIDYLTLNDNPTPPPIIGYGLPGAPLASYIDDPGTPITFTAAYKAPGKINRTYSVANTTDIYGTDGDFLWDVETSTPWITLTKSTPEPTLQNFNFTPPRPRQYQTFTMTINHYGLAPGVHNGEITFYGILFNDDFPPPSSGLVAINEPLVVPVILRISTAGGKAGPQSICATVSNPMTMGNSYAFVDAGTGERIADVLVTGGQIDDMTICAFPMQLPQNLARLRYVQRYWQIQANGAAWTADITFRYADQEMAMIFDPYQLRGIRQPVASSAWEIPIIGTTSTADPMNNSVTVVGMNQSNYMTTIALAHPYYIEAKQIRGTVPLVTELGQNYPNPFNPSTTIEFHLAHDGNVQLRVFDLYGREVASLLNSNLQAGSHQAVFDATGLPSGTYIYQLDVDGVRMTKTMTIMK